MSTVIKSTPLYIGTDQIQSPSIYTVYTALLDQSSTSAPVATILQNTTGATMTWARSTTGVYTVSCFPTGLFVAAKTLINCQVIQAGSTFANVFASNTPTVLLFITNAVQNPVDISGTNYAVTLAAQADSLLTKRFIEIRIYP